MPCRKDIITTKANKNKHEETFKIEGKSARSQRWFDIDFDWIEVKFSMCEPEFYKKIFQRNE